MDATPEPIEISLRPDIVAARKEYLKQAFFRLFWKATIAINKAVPFKDSSSKILLDMETYDELLTAGVRMFADLELGRTSRVLCEEDFAYLQKWADAGKRFYDERAVPGFFREGPPIAADDDSVLEYLRGAQPGTFGYPVSLDVMRDFFALADEYAQRYGEFCVVRYHNWPETQA